MRSRKANQLNIVPLKVIEDQGKQVQLSAPDIFQRNLVATEQDINSEALRAYLSNKMDEKQSGEIQQLEFDAQEKDEEYRKSKSRKDKLENERDAINPYIESRSLAGKRDDDKKVPYKEWDLDDKVKVCIAFPALLITLVMSFANVFSNLVGSSPVFIDNQMLAAFIAMLAPAGALALKLASQNFESYKGKKRYANTIYLSTAIAFLAWIVAFSLQYSGVNSQIIWSELEQSSGNSGGSVLVCLQILAEVLTAAALALAVQNIYLKYAPHLYVENPAYANFMNIYSAHLAQHEKLRAERNEIFARLTTLKAARATYIDEYIVALAELKERRAAANQ